MQQYGWKSARSRGFTNRRQGVCYCPDCMDDELAERKNVKRCKHRARQGNKKAIKEGMEA